MSSSNGVLSIYSPGAQLSIIDALLRPIEGASGSGSLSLELPAGIYCARAVLGNTETSKVVVVRAGASRRVDLPVDLEGAAPTNNTVTANESHSALTFNASLALSKAVGPRAGLIVVLRRLREPVTSTIDRPDLYDDQAQAVEGWGRNEDRPQGDPDGATAWWLRTPPGWYRLRFKLGNGRRSDQAIWLADGWQTVMFVPQSSHGPRPDDASVHMTELSVPWDGAGLDALAVEAAQAARRGNDHDALLAQVKRGAPQRLNPILALLAAHALIALLSPAGEVSQSKNEASHTRAGHHRASVAKLIRRNPYARELQRALTQLRAVLGSQPDVDSLQIAASKLGLATPRKLEVALPPMLADSYELLRRAAVSDDTILPADSLAEQVAGAAYRRGPWLTWTPWDAQRSSRVMGAAATARSRTSELPDQKATIAYPGPALPPVARGRIRTLIDEASAHLNMGLADASGSLGGVPEIAWRLAMPTALVRKWGFLERVVTDIVVSLPYLDLVLEELARLERLDVLVDAPSIGRTNEILGLALIPLNIRLDNPAIQGAPDGPGSVDQVLRLVRESFNRRFQGWQPQVDKNHLLSGIAGDGGFLSGSGAPLPELTDTPPPLRRGNRGSPARIAILDTPMTRGASVGKHVSYLGKYLPKMEPMPAEAGHAQFVLGLLQQAAPGAAIEVRATLNSHALADAWSVACAMAEYADSDVDIINVSFGCRTLDNQPPLLLQRAVNALSPRTLIVAAAGNHHQPTRPRPFWPAAFEDVLAVGAVNKKGRRASFSPRAPWVDLTAPGVNVVSTYLDGTVETNAATEHAVAVIESFPGYAQWRGTSLAAATVTGEIAAHMTPRRSARTALQHLLTLPEDRSVVRIARR